MREQDLWARLNEQLGEGYAQVWASMQALQDLDSRTVNQAIADRVDFKTIWRACWRELELPFSER